MKRFTVLLSICCIALPAWAQTDAKEQQVKVRLKAFKATQEDRDALKADKGLEGMKTVLSKLAPYDTFEMVATHEKAAPMGKETLIPINAVYTFFIEPQQQLESGNFEIAARIEMLEGDTYIDALTASGEATPGRALLFRGLDLDVGELVVMMELMQDSDDQGQSQQQQDDQQQPEGEPSEEQEQQGAQKKEKEEQEQGKKQKPSESQEQSEQQEQQQQPTQQMAEQQQEQGEEDRDLQNIEARLESLEEKDRREQKHARNRRHHIDFQGAWW